MELSPTTTHRTIDYRRVRYEIPRISACENVAAYSKEQIQQIAAHLRANQPWWRLYEASGAWRAAGQSLELVSSTLKQVNAVLADGWQSQDAVACQHSMQRLEATARHLADRSQQMATYTQEAGTVLAHGSERFPQEDPGLFQRMIGERGGWLDERNPFHNGPSEADYRHALATLNSDLLMVNTMLPTHVTGEFGIPGDAVEITDEPVGTSTGYAGGTGVIGTVGGSAVGSTSGAVTAPATGSTTAAGSVPVVGRLEDGSTGGLAGAAPPTAPGTGAPAPAATPATVTTGAPAAGAPIAVGPFAAGAAGAGSSAMAGRTMPAGGARPAVAQPGLIGGRQGAAPAAAAGRGVAGAPSGASAGAGRAGVSPGVIGGQQGAQSSVGRAAAGGRGPAGAAATPMARGGRGQDPDDSARDTWLTEDEDLWHDPDAAPAVIE